MIAYDPHVNPAIPSPLAASRAPARAIGWRSWVPNAITVLRLVLSAVFFIQVSLWTRASQSLPDWPLVLASICFAVAAITDVADGYLARRWNAVTRFGRIMDPFADKILVVGAFVMLAGPGFSQTFGTQTLQLTGVAPWMVVVILGRELLVTSIRAVLESEGRDFSAALSGKLKMIAQATVIPVVVLLIALTEVGPGTPARTAIDIMVWTTLILTVLSGVPYLVRGMSAFTGD